MDVFSAIAIALKGKQLIQEILSVGSFVKGKLETIEVAGPGEISELFFNDKLHYGNYVRGQGYLSEFAHTYLPWTYMPTIPGISSEKTLSRTYTSTGVSYRAQTLIKQTLFPLPVESLPTKLVSGIPLKIAFIYPKGFSGFIYSEDPSKHAQISSNSPGTPTLAIPENSKPIPVIIPANDHMQYLGRIVEFKAKITEIPDEWLKSLFRGLGPFSTEVFSFSYQPYNLRKKTLCLSLVDEKSEIKQAPGEVTLNHLKGALFIESHLEGYSGQAENVIGDVIPEIVRFPKSSTYAPYNDYSPFITTGKVRVIRRKPNIFGFYIETEIGNQLRYQSDLQILKEFYHKTGKNLQNALFDDTYHRYRMNMDFLFDYRLGSMFDQRGILSSTEANSVIKAQPELCTTRNWLIGQER